MIHDRAEALADYEKEVERLEGLYLNETRKVERLTSALKVANANHEHFEREWYLRGDEIERLRTGLLEHACLCGSSDRDPMKHAEHCQYRVWCLPTHSTEPQNSA